MLVVTDGAAEAIRALTSQSEGAGLRVSVSSSADDGAATALGVELVGDSLPGDEVVADKGCRVFIEGQVAPLLADKVLDARFTNGEKAVQFSITSVTDAAE